MINKITFVLCLFCAAASVASAQSKPAQKQSKENVLELETLRIEGYIYEPQILFILEKPSLDLISTEERKRHDFLKNIEKPLFETIY